MTQKDIYLPMIDKQVLEYLEDTDLIERDSNGEPQWSQTAVDFACLLKEKCT